MTQGIALAWFTFETPTFVSNWLYLMSIFVFNPKLFSIFLFVLALFFKSEKSNKSGECRHFFSSNSSLKFLLKANYDINVPLSYQTCDKNSDDKKLQS